MSSLITNTWSIEGVTVNKNNEFSYLGDSDPITGDYYLYFNLDSGQEHPVIKKIKIKDSLKRLSSSIKDYVKNGILYRNIGVFQPNKNTFFEIDNNAWDNSRETFGFYLSNPLLIKKESKILCNKLKTLVGSITRGNEKGIKCYENIIGIRVLKSDIGITENMTIKEMKIAISKYLDTSKLTILYELLDNEYELLEDYEFTLGDYDNNITNINTNVAENFDIEYPVEIIINNTVDIRQIEQIQVSIVNALNTIIDLKSDIENYKKSIDSTALEILEIKNSIDDKSNQMENSLQQIAQIKSSIDQLNLEITNKLNSINNTLEEINLLKVHFDDINDNILSFENKINNSIINIEANLDTNALLITRQDNTQFSIEIPVQSNPSNYYTKEDIDNIILEINNKLSSSITNEMMDSICK